MCYQRPTLTCIQATRPSSDSSQQQCHPHFQQAHLAAKGQIATFPVGIHPRQHFPADSWSGFPAHQLAQGPAAHRCCHLHLGPDHLLLMTAPHLNTIATTDNEFLQLLANYPELMTPTFSDKHPKHGVEHHITTHGTPVHAHTCRLLPEKLDASRLSSMPWKHGGRLPVQQPMVVPLHVVAKANGSWCPCGDYRRLNDVTTPDHYPVSHIQDVRFSAQLAGMCIYSKVDLVWGYHQIPVHHNDITKTAIITLFDLYEFLQMSQECRTSFSATDGHAFVAFLCIWTTS